MNAKDKHGWTPLHLASRYVIIFKWLSIRINHFLYVPHISGTYYCAFMIYTNVHLYVCICRFMFICVCACLYGCMKVAVHICL